jgi:hypothetical protein
VALNALIAMFLIAPSAGGVPGDPTPPEITPTLIGTLGSSGWYRSNVTVNWSIVDAESIILGTDCVLATTLSADTPGTKLTCRAWSDGGETTKSVTIKLDKTAPTASAAADRSPDANGWYSHALTVTSSGTDAISGMESCTSSPYAGPDNPSALIAGSCRDVAGNVAGTSLSFKYDATAPSLSMVSAKPGNRSLSLAWKASTDTSRIQVARAPGRNGAAETVFYPGTAAIFRDSGLIVGQRYRYRVTGFDTAENKIDQTVDVVGTGALIRPFPAQKVLLASLPYLDWTPVRGAAYYNVQLVRGRKVLSAWPAQSSFRLRRTWTYDGRRYRLRPGLYRWYVWPGFGRISAARYGRLLGSSTFVVSG